MKKMKLKIIWVLLGLIIVSWIVDASTYRSDYFRLNNWHTESMESWKYCKEIVNNSGKHLFIPLKTELEFYNFLIHKPSWITIRNRCFIADWFNWTYYTNPHSYWHTTKTRGGHINICMHWTCKKWYQAWAYNFTSSSINWITVYRKELYKTTNNWTKRWFYYIRRD